MLCMFGIKRVSASFLFAFSLLLFSVSGLAAEISPTGNWQTIDDKTHKPRSIVQIWKDRGELQGRIIKIYFRQGEKDTDVCKQCRDPEHKNQRILGMTILWGMQQKNALRWSGGKILDPENGETYHAQLGLTPNGQQLTVRGYIGIPLFGRSQTWLRVN